VANIGAATISIYSFDSTVGTLGLVGTPVTTAGQPSAIATKWSQHRTTSQHKTTRPSFLRQSIERGLCDRFVNFRLGAAGCDTANNLAIYQNWQSALIGEEVWKSEHFDTAFL